MGFNGTFLACSDEGVDVAGRLPGVVRSFFEQQGASFVAATALGEAEAEADRHLFGIAIAPSIQGWIAIADTGRRPSAALAAMLAAELATPVVLSSIAEICDPPQPEHVRVFGAVPHGRFNGLYELIGFHYEHLARPDAHIHGAPPFDPNAVGFATFRAATPQRAPAIFAPGDLGF